MSHPQAPQRPPTDNERVRYSKALHNTALATIIACPLLALLPPRKLDVYTFGLGATTVFSASWLVRERTGRSIWQHIGFGGHQPAFNSSGDIPTSIQSREEADLQRELHDATQEIKRMKMDGRPSVTEQLQSQRDSWKTQRQKEIKEEVEEGKGFGDMIMDQIWEVWHWRKKTDDDE